MQNVRGFVYFENRTLTQIKEDFWNFKVPGIDYKFFDGLIRLKKKIKMPGILVDGEVNVKNKESYSKKIVELLRERAGLEKGTINCDVSSSLSNEDYIKHLKKGQLIGKYIAIRILPPYPKINELEKLAFEIGDIADASDILLRGVESIIYKDRKIDKRCIDLIGKINFNTKKEKLERHLESRNLVLEGYTILDLL